MIAWLLWLGCRTLHAAESAEPRYLHSLLHARTAAQVDVLKHDYESLQVARLACRLQLRAETVPDACYQSLRLETRLGFYRETKHRQLLAHLDRLCRHASARLHVPTGRLADVSAPCARWVQEARRIQDYRADAHAP